MNNIALMDIFDRQFARRFPGIPFTRFNNEVFLSSRKENDFNEKVIYDLLKEGNLSGNIQSIGPNDEPAYKNWLSWTQMDRYASPILSIIISLSTYLISIYLSFISE